MKQFLNITKLLTLTILAGSLFTSCHHKVPNETLAKVPGYSLEIILNSLKKHPVNYFEALRESSRIAMHTHSHMKEKTPVENNEVAARGVYPVENLSELLTQSRRS